MSVHGLQTGGPDGLQGTGVGAVVEVRRRGGWRQAQVHGDGVALVGADPGAVDREAPFVIGGDDSVEFLAGEAEAVLGRRGDQGVDVHPAGGVEGEADAGRLVAEVPGEVLRDLDRASFVHGVHGFFVHGFRVVERRGSRSLFSRGGLIHRQPRLSTGELAKLWTTGLHRGGVEDHRPQRPHPAHTFGSTRASRRSAPGSTRDRRCAPRASGVTGTTGRLWTTASRIAEATFSGG